MPAPVNYAKYPCGPDLFADKVQPNDRKVQPKPNDRNRKLTPTRKRFLQIAVENNGEIELTRGGINPSKFRVGVVTLSEASGRALQAAGLIERVLIPGTQSTEPTCKSPSGYVLGYRYRVTDAGRAAIT